MATDSRLHRMPRPEECGICLDSYDEQECRPRNLPCGHTFCSECVSTLLEDDYLTCPSCRTNHWAPNISHFPISYALENMIRAMKARQTGVDLQATGGASKMTGDTSQSPTIAFQARGINSKLKATVGLSKKMQSVLEEQRVNMKSLEVTLQQELDQLHQYRAQLAFSVSEHGRMIEELDKYVQQHQATMHLLQEEDAKMEAYVEEGMEVQRELKVAQSLLDQANTAQKAIDTTVSIDSNIARVEMWLQHSKEEIPNGTVVNTSYRVLETTEAALEVVPEDTAATPVQIPSGHLDCTIMEAVKNAEGRPIKLVDLSCKKVREKMDAGQVFAVLRNEDGHWYSSKMTYNGHKVYVHSLQNQPPPKGASTLEVSKTVQNLDHFSTLMFMDLSWKDGPPAFQWGGMVPLQPTVSKQRFHTRLETDTPLVKKFITRCLGHTGLTFCNTRMLIMEGNCNGTLTVWEGDTSGRDRVSGAVPLRGFHFLVAERKTVTPSRGMLLSRINVAHDEQSMKFGIVIDDMGNRQSWNQRSYSNSNTTTYCLGHIETAELKSLETAVKNNHSLVVNVDDCGVVLQQ